MPGVVTVDWARSQQQSEWSGAIYEKMIKYASTTFIPLKELTALFKSIDPPGRSHESVHRGQERTVRRMREWDWVEEGPERSFRLRYEARLMARIG